MLVFKKILCGALAVVMTTSSAFAVGKISPDVTSNDLSQAANEPFFADGKYEFLHPASNTRIGWVPDPAAARKEISDFIKEMASTKMLDARKQQDKELAKIKQDAQHGKLVGAAVHTLKSFHGESFAFFLGMGAVAFAQLVFDNSQNPVGGQQHISHSLSPMGMAGFAIFMYVNNLTSSTLQTMIKNPAFMKYVPYLGMSAGFMGQSIFSHMASDPNIKACISNKAFNKTVTEKDKAIGIDESPCLKAWDNFEDLRLAPALTSMLLSTYLAGKGQNAAKFLYDAGKKEALKLTGFNVAMSVVPGKVQVSAIRMLVVQGLGKVAQITAFVQIDAWLNRIVTYGWKNLFDGKEFYDINQSIVDRVNYLKSTDWQEYKTQPFLPGFLTGSFSEWIEKDRSLEDRLKFFQKRMADWRMTNLADVYEAHQNWNTALGQLIGNYKASFEFYQNMIDRIRLARFKPLDVQPLKLLYPLSGLKAYNLTEDRYDSMFTHPKLFETYQRENLAFVAKALSPQLLNLNYPIVETSEELLELSKKSVGRRVTPLEGLLMQLEIKKGEYANFLRLQQLLADLNVAERKKIESFRQVILGTNDVYEPLLPKDQKALATALYNLRREYNPALREPEKPYSKMILALIDILGAPSPQMEPGRGYLLAYEFSPKGKQLNTGIDFSDGSSIFGTNLITDYYLMQMVCGPDVEAGESVVEETMGFPAQFNPPMIRPAKHRFKDECIGYKAFMEPDKIYSYKFEQDGKNYRGFLDYVRNTARTSIIGTKDATKFNDWWSNHTTKQIQTAFDTFSERYDEIVVKMVRGLYYTREKSVTDFIYDSFGLNQKGKSSLNTGPVYNGTMKAIFQEEGMYLAILEEMMSPGRIFDYRLDPAAQYKNDIQSPVLQEVHMEMKKLEALIQKIKIVEIKGRERIESSLTKDEMKSQLEAVAAALTTVRQAMNLDVTGVIKMDSPLALRENQKVAAKFALTAIQNLAEEMANYMNIADAVSWNKIHDSSNNETTVPKVDENTKKALKYQGPATNPAGR